MMNRYLILLLFAYGSLCASLTHAQDSLQTLSVTTLPIPASVPNDFLDGTTAKHVIADPDYNVWGMSVIRWTDGKYHGYYSRWPKKHKHNGWLTHCEIVHAISDKPEGPFKPVGVALESRNPGGWDLVNAHNPYVCIAEGKVCLYYISNKLEGKYPDHQSEAAPTDDWMKENRDIVRNSQCIGVAIADHPDGPFKRADHPVVEPHGKFKNIAVNPAVVYRDGVYTLMLKGDDIGQEKKYRIQFIGYSDRPDGPFDVQEDSIFDQTQTEDASMWYDKEHEQFYMTVHVMKKPYLSLFSSKDGREWQQSGPPEFISKKIKMDDGSEWKTSRTERPFILTDEQGKPVMLYVSVSYKKGNGNIAIPLTLNPMDSAKNEGASGNPK